MSVCRDPRPALTGAVSEQRLGKALQIWANFHLDSRMDWSDFRGWRSRPQKTKFCCVWVFVLSDISVTPWGNFFKFQKLLVGLKHIVGWRSEVKETVTHKSWFGLLAVNSRAPWPSAAPLMSVISMNLRQPQMRNRRRLGSQIICILSVCIRNETVTSLTATRSRNTSRFVLHIGFLKGWIYCFPDAVCVCVTDITALQIIF